MKVWALLALLFFLPTVLADRDPCEDYCRDGVFYTGVLNTETQLCAYRQTPCEHGCGSDGQGCAAPIPTITIPDVQGTAPSVAGDAPERRAPTAVVPRTSTTPGITLFQRKATPIVLAKRPFVPRGTARVLKQGACFSDADCAKDTTLSKCEGAWQCLQLATKGAGKCVPVPGMAVVCEKSGFPCDKAVCNPATGECAFVPDLTKKTPKGKPCQCHQDKDCAAFEDGNLCNGVLYCDMMEGACKVNPATEIKCGTSSDTGCTNNLCNPKTGKCAKAPVNEGKTCVAEHPCIDATCSKGACVGTWNYDKQVKGQKCQCKSEKDCAKHEDGDLCNGTLFCNLATTECQLNPATKVTCQTVDDTACGKNLCNPKSGKCGMTAINEGLPCYSSLCYDGTCAKGKCGTFLNGKCECVADKDCAKKQKDKCSGAYYCDKSKGKCMFNPSTIVTCPTVDDTTCLKNTCEPATGKCAMKPESEGTLCDLGHACIDAACSKGSCAGSWNFAKVVNGKKCQCKNDKDCAKYEDGIACNGTLYCDKAATTCKINPKTVTC